MKAPPFAVLLDRKRSQVVITVRGTLNLSDCVSDALAAPVFFDPFRMARPSEGREAPFNESEGLFVHSGFLACAQDALRRLQEQRVLEAARQPGGRAAGWPVVCTGHSLGAGVACILAMLLHAELGSAVRYVGLEPPGGSLSRRLAQETERLGWLSGICSHDWVPRLSVLALQELREAVLDELMQCPRSKLQVTALLLASACRRRGPLRLLAPPLEFLGGGSLACSARELPQSARGSTRSLRALVEARRQHLEGAGSREWATRLVPPGRLLWVRPQHREALCCGLGGRDAAWEAAWVEASALGSLVLDYKSVELHFPHIVKRAFASAVATLETAAADGTRLGLA